MTGVRWTKWDRNRAVGAGTLITKTSKARPGQKPIGSSNAGPGIVACATSTPIHHPHTEVVLSDPKYVIVCVGGTRRTRILAFTRLREGGAAATGFVFGSGCTQSAPTTTAPAAPPQAVTNPTVEVAACPTYGAGFFQPKTLAFEPARIVECARFATEPEEAGRFATVHTIVWTTWGVEEAHGVGSLVHYRWTVTKTDCTKYCGTPITPATGYCPGHAGTPTWASTGLVDAGLGKSGAYCGKTTAPTTACTLSTQSKTECPTRTAVYAPIGWVWTSVTVTLSNPVHRTGRLVWGTMVACSTSATSCYRVALPGWGT